jgi:hypothetical protein
MLKPVFCSVAPQTHLSAVFGVRPDRAPSCAIASRPSIRCSKSARKRRIMLNYGSVARGFLARFPPAAAPRDGRPRLAAAAFAARSLQLFLWVADTARRSPASARDLRTRAARSDWLIRDNHLWAVGRGFRPHPPPNAEACSPQWESTPDSVETCAPFNSESHI